MRKRTADTITLAPPTPRPSRSPISASARPCARSCATPPVDGGYVRLALPAGPRAATAPRWRGGARASACGSALAGELVPALLHRGAGARRRRRARRRLLRLRRVRDRRPLLFRHNQTADAAFSYRVYAETDGAVPAVAGPAVATAFRIRPATPDGYQPPLVAPNLVTLQNARSSQRPVAGRRRDADHRQQRRRVHEHARPTASARPTPTNATSRCRSTATCTRARRRQRRSTTCTTSTSRPNANRRQVMAGRHQPVLLDQLPARLVLRRRLRRSRRATRRRQLRSRRPRQGDGIVAPGAGLLRHQQRQHVDAGRRRRPRMQMFVWRGPIALGKVKTPAAIAGVKQCRHRRLRRRRRSTSPATLVLAHDAADAAGPTTTDGCSR